MKTAAIIPVKTFAKAKTRLNLSPQKIENLCLTMLEEILRVLCASRHIDDVILVTREQKAIKLSEKYNGRITVIIDKRETGRK